MARTVHRSPSPLHLLAFHPFLPHPLSLSLLFSRLLSRSLPLATHPLSRRACFATFLSLPRLSYPSTFNPLFLRSAILPYFYRLLPSRFSSPPPALPCKLVEARRAGTVLLLLLLLLLLPLSRACTSRYVTLRYVTLRCITYVPPTRSLAR